MNTVTMYSLLRRAQRGLNLIIVGSYTINAIGFSALASGIFMIISRWLGWSGANFLGWSLFTCSGGLLGLLIAFGYKRWDEAAVARWVDSQFGFQEAITSALICIERDCSGLLDQAIVERAQSVTSAPLEIQWPLSRFYRQTIQAGLLIGVAVLALILVPAHLKIHSQPAEIRAQVKNKTQNGSVNHQEPPVLKPLTPREMAQILFPQDPQLMVQAEKAILAADMDLLRELLRKSMFNSEPMNLDRSSPASPQNLSEKREQLMQSLLTADSMEEVQQMMDQNQGQESKLSEKERQDRDGADQKLAQRKSTTGSGKKPGQSQQNQGNQRKDQNQNPYQANNPKMNGANSAFPGSGQGPKTNTYKKITPQSDSSKKPIILATKGGFFEYLMPGKDTKVPLAGVLPGAAQASEQALSRQGVPSEYADFTRSYFLKLSQYITGSSPESEGPP